MEAIYSEFNFIESVGRINEILSSSDQNYEEKESIPIRTSLTFTNGYHVSASALFVDIRNSKDLTDKHTKPKLAKLYRSYISEVVAVLKGDTNVNEIYIEGDGVWGVFDTPHKNQIDAVFETASKVSSLIDILNFRYSKYGGTEIQVGIGLTYGTALYIKAGYKSSGINEVVWLGKLVGEAAELCSYGNKTYSDYEVMVSSVIYSNLKADYQKLLTWNANRSCYHGNVIDIAMNNWLKEQIARN